MRYARTICNSQQSTVNSQQSTVFPLPMPHAPLPISECFMSEKQPNQPISFSSFADWCRHIDSLSESARHTVKVLLKKAGTDDPQAAEQILSSMTTLDLGSRITDISSLGSLTNLTTLNLNSNQITDISSLGSLTNLTTLNLDNNQISDISFLGSLTNLTTLNLDNNQISDISFLGSLTNLTTLNLCSNQITDISALRKLTNLTKLDLRANRITDISVLGLLAQKRLTLSTTPIDAQKATEAVKVAYAAIGLEEPQVIIYSSPRDAFLQMFNLPKGDHSPNWSNEGQGNRLGKKLDWEWMSISPSIVRDFTSPAVWEYEIRSMTIEPEADRTLTLLMYELVNSYAKSERTMGNVFPDHLLDLKFAETPTSLFKKTYLTEVYISSLSVNILEKAQ